MLCYRRSSLGSKILRGLRYILNLLCAWTLQPWVAEFSLITAPFINRVEHRHAPLAASVIQPDRSPVVLLQILSSSLPGPCSIFSSLDPLSYMGRAIFDRYAVRLAAG